MNIPSVGLFRSEKHDYWFNGEGPLVGVTGTLRIIDKPAIATWAKRETARCAIRNWDMLQQMRATGGDEAAVAWLEKIPDYQKDTAARIGSAVHRLAELAGREMALEASAEELPFVDAYRRFLADYRVKLLSLEKGVISLTHGYGGTFDLIFTLGGQTWLCDIKTSKGTYAETALQLAAYANADFVALENDPKRYRIPTIDRFAVLHLRPDAYASGYSLVEYAIGPGEFNAFLAALRLSKWSREAHPVGEPVPNKWTKKKVA